MEISNKVLFKEHQRLCRKCQSQYERKQTDYNDSFGRTYRKLGENGILSAYTIITNKYNRFDTLVNNGSKGKKSAVNETLVDTLMDLADYCFMTVMELQREAGIQEEDDLCDDVSEEVSELVSKRQRLVETSRIVCPDLAETTYSSESDTTEFQHNTGLATPTGGLKLQNIPHRAYVESGFSGRNADN